VGHDNVFLLLREGDNMSIGTVDPDCNDTRQCFAMQFVHGGFRVCKILTSTYRDNGECPFCKPEKDKVQSYESGRDE